VGARTHTIPSGKTVQDATVYEKDERAMNPIIRGAEIVVHQNENHPAQRFVRCMTIHDGTAIDLGEHQIR
jgi:hypothetical protein